MKRTRKITFLCVALLMVIQVVLPTINYALDTVKLNIQKERPYSDDDGDEEVGDDIYTLVRQAIQTVFKIGDQDESGNLSFNNAYYCLRGGLGFGSTEEIVQNGVDYRKLADLTDAEKIKAYFKDEIKHEISDENYNAICWIAENMYLPKSEYAEELKAELQEKYSKYVEETTEAEIEKQKLMDWKLTDDDIEVVQQIALWYFTNFDENGGANSVSLAKNVDLANLLQINNTQPNNDLEVSYNKDRADQINKLYQYFIEKAVTEYEANKVYTPVELELDKTLEPTIEEKKLSIGRLNALVVGPFKINEKQAGNLDFAFTCKLQYKTSSEAEWEEIEIDNQTGMVYLSDANGNELDRSKDVEDMVKGEKFYISILKDVLDIADIKEFKISISYNSHYYNTMAEVLVADTDDQPVLKVEKERVENSGNDEIIAQKKEKEFDLSLRKFITGTNGNNLPENVTREPKIYLETLRKGTYNRNGELEYTATYVHPKNPIYLKKGNTIIYTIRVYNEGDLDGYVKEITDYLCDGLEFVQGSNINNKYQWELGEDGKTLTSRYLENTLIKAYDSTMTKEVAERENSVWQKAEDGTDGLYYAELQIECRIKEDAQVGITLPNVAEISEDLAEGETQENPIEDRDSQPKNLTDDDVRNYENSPWYEDDDDYERVIVEPDEVFDLSLRKYITEVNGEEVTDTRIPNIDASALDAKTNTTAEYKHRKDPVEVKTGDIVTYNITIYNEGEAKGRATKIVDQLPTGLEFIEVVSGNYSLENYDKEANKVTLKETENNQDLDAKEPGRDPSSTTVTITCKVTAKVEENDKVLTNVAWIAEDYNAENNEITDRDSQPTTSPDVNKDNMSDYKGKTGEDGNKSELDDDEYYYKGEQDDDDFEKLIIKGKNFDLALRKYIRKIERKGEEVEFPSRIPQVDTTPLKQGKTTADYIHPKDVLTVKHGDIITYRIRVYNEGELDGYVKEVTDYIPAGLGFLNGYSGNDTWLIETENVENKPLVGENGIYKTQEEVPENGIFKGEDLSKISVVTGTAGSELEITNSFLLRDKLIKKYGSEIKEEDEYQQSVNDENDGLFYREVEVTCIVLAPNTYKETITNIAEISKDQALDEEGNEVDVPDRDSDPDNLTEEERKEYEENPWYEDDDDYEPVQLKYFDLALRKFITGVNEKEVNTRIPQVDTTPLKEGEETAKYEHPKTPVEVVDGDEVTYTIRVYNEGTIAGYAEEIEDDIPEGLIYLPENSTNKEYGWKMYYRDENGELVETDDVEKAEVIRTEYLSEANGTIDEETGKNSNLLEGYDSATMETLDYRDVKVVFKVSQKDIPEENESGIIVNKAHITKDSDDDEDSTPDKWKEEDDDQDKEYVYVQKFDLALFKWVTKTIVTVDGKTTTTETGFKPNVGKTEAEGDGYRDNSEQEPIASVVIDKKKLNRTVVKFVYTIKVVNEGDIEGYATEITDYIPEGLKFEQEDNPLWTQVDGNKITTRALETILLKPGESTTIEVTFRWINGEDNLGLKRNISAITEDYNEKGVPDEDSTPGNEKTPGYDKEQEDDDDFADVILTLKTGKQVTYIWLVLVTMTIITAGTVLIKKYVL